MKKQFSTRLKESCIDNLQELAKIYKISQADVIEKLVDFLWITTDDIKHNRGKEIDDITFLANIRNLIQTLR